MKGRTPKQQEVDRRPTGAWIQHSFLDPGTWCTRGEDSRPSPQRKQRAVGPGATAWLGFRLKPRHIFSDKCSHGFEGGSPDCHVDVPKWGTADIMLFIPPKHCAFGLPERRPAPSKRGRAHRAVYQPLAVDSKRKKSVLCVGGNAIVEHHGTSRAREAHRFD